jgi:hypothetical protein
MKSSFKKILVATVAVGGLVAGTSAASFAARPGTSLPPGTKVKAALASGTNMVFNGQIDGAPITVTCKTFKASGKIPATSTYTMNVKPPTISSCTDSLGGTDTITTNDTNGSWALTSTTSSPYTFTLSVPKKGATFTSSVLKSCTIIVGPKGATGIAGSYNSSTGVDSVSGASFAVGAKGTCTTSATSSATATVDFTPNPGAPPF